MLAKLLAYAPSRIVPAVVSIGGIYFFTRYLSPHQFGLYGLALGIHMVALTAVFSVFASTVVRQYPVTDPSQHVVYHATVYRVLFGIVLLVVGIAVLAWLMILPDDHRTLFLLITTATVMRGVVGVNLGIHQINDRVFRFGVLETLSSTLSVTLSLLLIIIVAPSAANMMLGLTLANGLVALLDLPLYWLRQKADWGLVRSLLWFAAPLSLCALVSTTFGYADRLVLGSLGGAGAGLYQVAITLVDRPINIVTAIVAVTYFPRLVQAAEHRGPVAAKHECNMLMLTLLFVLLPCCAGLAVTHDQLSFVMVGPEFRQSTSVLLPWLSVMVLMRMFSAHFFDSCFVIARRPEISLRIYLPVTVVSVPIVIGSMSLWGVNGVAAAMLFCQAALVTIQTLVLRRVYPCQVQWNEIGKIIAATAVMAAVLLLWPVPVSPAGLAAQIGIGAVLYGSLSFALNTLGFRKFMRAMEQETVP